MRSAGEASVVMLTRMDATPSGSAPRGIEAEAVSRRLDTRLARSAGPGAARALRGRVGDRRSLLRDGVRRGHHPADGQPGGGLVGGRLRACHRVAGRDPGSAARGRPGCGGSRRPDPCPHRLRPAAARLLASPGGIRRDPGRPAPLRAPCASLPPRARRERGRRDRAWGPSLRQRRSRSGVRGCGRARLGALHARRPGRGLLLVAAVLGGSGRSRRRPRRRADAGPGLRAPRRRGRTLCARVGPLARRVRLHDGLQLVEAGLHRRGVLARARQGASGGAGSGDLDALGRRVDAYRDHAEALFSRFR